jgi:hypothetical protein
MTNLAAIKTNRHSQVFLYFPLPKEYAFGANCECIQEHPSADRPLIPMLHSIDK